MDQSFKQFATIYNFIHYFHAGVSAVASNYKQIMQSIFKTTSLNQAGIIVGVVYVKGIPTIVAIDDYIPYTLNNSFAFA